MKKGIIYPELSYKIMQAVFVVHNELGPGFLESVYEEALVYELAESGIQAARQHSVQVFYRGQVVGTHRQLKKIRSIRSFVIFVIRFSLPG